MSDLFFCVDDTKDLPMIVKVPLAIMFFLILYFVAGFEFWVSLLGGSVAFFGRFLDPVPNKKKTIRLTSDVLEIDRHGPGIGERISTWPTSDIQPGSVVCKTSKPLKRCRVTFRTRSGKRGWVEIPGVAEGQRFSRLLREVAAGRVDASPES